jgi:hypothetical protein
MKHQKFLQQILSIGWILFFLTACCTYGTTPATVPQTVASVPTISTKVAFPLTGSVEIEEGRCCIGGLAGDTIQARVEFSAMSPFGKVNSMRVRAAGQCFTETEMEVASWEPFVPSKTYSVAVALNWIGFYISVQFQDEYGNVSPVYCDDISVEGSPPLNP